MSVNMTNNAVSVLASGILSGATSMTITTGEGALFPSAFPYNLVLSHLDTNSNVTKREIVTVTNRVSDTFTITRGAEACVQDDTATPKVSGTTAQAFDAGDLVGLYALASDFEKIDTLDGLVVHNTGNETVGGIKTFTSFPVTPSSAPTTDYQAANKKYVDDNAGGDTQIRIYIPGELLANTSASQGFVWRNTTGASVTISNVEFYVSKAAAGSGAACAFNVYKSSGTAADGIDTNAVALFSSAVDLTTNYEDLTNVPNTTTVEDGRYVSARVTSSAGATNKASNGFIVITLA